MQMRRPATFWTRQLRWRRLDVPGFELAEIGERARGFDVRGMLIGEADGQPFGTHYHMRIGTDWKIKGLNLQMLDGRALKLRSDGKGQWRENDGAQRPDLCDCVDIDLSGSAFTNALPISRAKLETGETESFTMAYIDLPSLSVSPHVQDYTGLGDGRFAYRSQTTGYTAELETDSEGFLTLYPGLFQLMEI